MKLGLWPNRSWAVPDSKTLDSTSTSKIFPDSGFHKPDSPYNSSDLSKLADYDQKTMEKGRGFYKIRPIAFLVYTDPFYPHHNHHTFSPFSSYTTKPAREMVMDFTVCKSAGLFFYGFFLQGKKT